MKEKIGIIGIGTIGKRVATNLQNAGYEIIAYDTDSYAQEYCVDHGIYVSDGLTNLVNLTNKIFICVAHKTNSFVVVKELSHILTKNHTVIETTFITPDDMKLIENYVISCGAKFMECQILGNPDDCGNWLVATAGDKKTVDGCEELLNICCKEMEYVGDVPKASAIKSLSNMLYSIFNMAICETMVIAKNTGIDLELYYDLISSSQAVTNGSVFQSIAKRISTGRYEFPERSLEDMAIENAYILDYAKEQGISPILTLNSLNCYANAVACGYGKEDPAALYEYFQQVFAR